MATSIHPTAIVEPGAQLGQDCDIQAYAIVKRGVTLGDRVAVHPFAVIGGDPQVVGFGELSSYVRVGADTKLREHVTIHRGSKPDAVTVIGDHCLLMAGAHVGHDCQVGNSVVIANAALLAGYVEVGDHCILGGACAFHQNCRVGEGTMVGGGARITLDIAPFSLITERDELVGINLIGLRRRGASRAAIAELKQAVRQVYSMPGNIREVAAEALSSGRYAAPETRRFLEFFAAGRRGFARLRSLDADEAEKD
jgi:UDP-N-acetylglucosamine acyltransferase